MLTNLFHPGRAVMKSRYPTNIEFKLMVGHTEKTGFTPRIYTTECISELDDCRMIVSGTVTDGLQLTLIDKNSREGFAITQYKKNHSILTNYTYSGDITFRTFPIVVVAVWGGGDTYQIPPLGVADFTERPVLTVYRKKAEVEPTSWNEYFADSTSQSLANLSKMALDYLSARHDVEMYYDGAPFDIEKLDGVARELDV